MAALLRQYVWLGWGFARLGGVGVGWLVGWRGGAVTASHWPRLLGIRARRASGNNAGTLGAVRGGRRLGRGDSRPQVIIDTGFE